MTRPRNNNPCSVPGCERPGRTRQGMCEMHYERKRRHGSELYVPPVKVTAGYPCPKCGGDKTKVTNTRRQDSGGVWRKRHCPACNERFSTVESQAVVAQQAKEMLYARLMITLDRAQEIMDLIRAEHD